MSGNQLDKGERRVSCGGGNIMCKGPVNGRENEINDKLAGAEIAR